MKYALFVFAFLFSNSAGAQEVKGYADYHIHMMAEYAYGGAWLHGSHKGAEHEAMKSCSGNFPVRDHARTKLWALNEFIAKTHGTHGDTGLHLKKRSGFPEYKGWPRWNTIAHQQVWEGFLKNAHDQGLNLIVMSAVNFRPLCELMPDQNMYYDCNDMNAVQRQIAATHEFVKTHSWAEIALSSKHARQIIQNGKLAIVLAIEVSDLIQDGDWLKQLEYYRALGVRSIQPVHQLDNRFSGAALHHFIFKLFEFIDNLKGFKTDEHGHNLMGLTGEGRMLIDEMIKREMILDLAHMSERSVLDTRAFLLNKYRKIYPLFMSHTHIREMLADSHNQDEKTSPHWLLQLIRDSGGVMGLRTGQERMKSYGRVENNCDGSSKSFAQAANYAEEILKIKTGFATDFNGFIQQLRPRFGNRKEACGSATSKKERKRQQSEQAKPTGESFDLAGLGHIGMLPSLLHDLKNLGANTKSLEKSAQHFIEMWEAIERFEPEIEPTRGLASKKPTAYPQ